MAVQNYQFRVHLLRRKPCKEDATLRSINNFKSTIEVATNGGNEHCALLEKQLRS